MAAGASAAIDRGVAWWMQKRMAAAPARAPLPPDARRRVEELARHYANAPLFAPVPSADVTWTVGAGGVRDAQFESLYRPTLPSYRAEHARYGENLVAHARWWRSAAARPTVILLHGWSQGPYWMTERILERAAWQAVGFDVAALQLPFHGVRAPSTPGERDEDRWFGPRSGMLFPSPHIARTCEGFGQAIADLRQLSTALRAEGATGIAVAGVSLGGYVASLWAGLDAIAAVVAVTPAVDLADLMAAHGGNEPAWRRAAAAGIDRDLLADAFAAHAPLAHAPTVAPAGRFVIAGRGDAVIPGDQADRLAAHWGTQVRWFAGGHTAQIGMATVLRRTIDDAAAALGLAP